MIVQLILWRIFRIVSHESVKLLLAERQIIEFIFEDNARIIQPILYHLMSCCLCLFGERYLCQIILSLMRIINSRIHTLLFFLLGFLHSHQRIALLICHHLETICLKDVFYNSLIITSPVINIIALTPHTLEGLLSLQYCLRIIEIPRCGTTSVHVHNRHRGSGILV